MDLCNFINFEAYTEFGFGKTQGMCLHKSKYKDGSVSIRNAGQDVGWLTSFGLVVKCENGYHIISKTANTIVNADTVVRPEQDLILLLKEDHPVACVSYYGTIVPEVKKDMC